MKKNIIGKRGIIAFLFIGGCTCPEQQQNESLFQPQISFFDSLVDPWVNMWNTYDLSLVDSLFAADSNITYFSSEKEGLITGIEAVRKHHEGFGFVKGGKKMNTKLWAADLTGNTREHTIIISGIWYFQKESDSLKVQKGPFTAVYVPIGKKYKIAHMHFASYK